MLGNNKPRNWGKDSQIAALHITERKLNVAHEIKGNTLIAWPKNAEAELKALAQSIATLENVSRGRWDSYDMFDGSLITSGCSQRDCIRKTLERRWM